MEIPQMFDKVVVVMVEFHKPGTKRAMSSDKMTSDADKELLRAQKIIIESDILDKIQIGYYRLKTILRRKCLPTMARDGMYLCPLASVAEIDTALKQGLDNTRSLAAEFKRSYPKLMAEAKRRLRSEFNEADYVSADAVESSFGITWRFVEFNTPTKLKSISSDLYASEMRKVKASMLETERMIQALLRERFAKVVERISEKLVDGKRIQGSLDKVEEFYSDFKSLNVTDDRDLAALVKRAQDLLKGVDGAALRDDDKLRERIAVAFDSVQNKITSMIGDVPRRRIKVAKEAA